MRQPCPVRGREGSQRGFASCGVDRAVDRCGTNDWGVLQKNRIYCTIYFKLIYGFSF